MSYVELKHLLAELALEATRRPQEATWATVLAAYGRLADAQHAAVGLTIVLGEAAPLGKQFGWTPTHATLAPLVDAGLLVEDDGQVRVLPAFGPHLPYLRQQSARLLEAIALLVHSAAPRTVPDDLWRGVVLFNTGLFFECHEAVENLWRSTRGPEKEFYRGLVQVATAFYHYEKHNLRGAHTLLGKGLHRLEAYPSPYRGIDLDSFRSALRPWMTIVASDGSQQGSQRSIPIIELRDQ